MKKTIILLSALLVFSIWIWLTAFNSYITSDPYLKTKKVQELIQVNKSIEMENEKLILSIEIANINIKKYDKILENETIQRNNMERIFEENKKNIELRKNMINELLSTWTVLTWTVSNFLEGK